jgi:trehalose 6-phosphate synthase
MRRKGEVTRIVAVSNRIALPTRGCAPGGLAVGLLAAMRERGGVWFGWDGVVGGETRAAPVVVRDGAVEYVATHLAASEYDEYYLGFCNSLLWPLFHYFTEGFHYREGQFDAYLTVNHRFAAELVSFLEPGDAVWVHDFHLIPLARFLRDEKARHPLGLFLHIPFPTIEVLRILPVYRQLLELLLEYDVLGFQTEGDLMAFRGAIAAVWGEDAVSSPDCVRAAGRHTTTKVFPIGVDPPAIQREALAALESEQSRRMKAGLLGRRLMIGVDRLDYSKGLVHRFRAYEQFLESYPDHQNRVTFLQIAPLSRMDVRAYSQIRHDLEQVTGRTNGRFADTDWTPIRYLNRNFPHDVLMSFLRTAHVGIVTPLRDGMNLVAKEFVAAQDPADPGVLILSLLAGAARELSTALLVNPHDPQGIAQAIEQAFSMSSPERRERHQAMLEVLNRNSLHAWHRDFVHALDASRPS